MVPLPCQLHTYSLESRGGMLREPTNPSRSSVPPTVDSYKVYACMPDGDGILTIRPKFTTESTPIHAARS